MNGFARAAIAAIALSLGAAGAEASVTYTYTYTGNDFTSVDAPYTTSDHVTISFKQSSALAPNFSGDFSTTPIAFSISDGVQTINNSIFLSNYQVGTDSTGKITSWNVSADFGENAIYSQFGGGAAAKDFADDPNETGTSSGGSNSNDPGTWTVTTTGVPEPATWAMMLGGFGGLGLAMRSRRKPAALTA